MTGTLQAYFKKEWAQLVEVSFRNFLAEAIEQMPLPTVLRFDADRQQRLELQEQCRSLQKQNAQLKQARAHSGCLRTCSHHILRRNASCLMCPMADMSLAAVSAKVAGEGEKQDHSAARERI